jgi:hypothetical protein
MKRLFALSLLLGCTSAPTDPKPTKSTSLEGRFLLQGVAQPTSTSPQMFPAEDWAKGLTLSENPSSLLLQRGRLSAAGVLALSGTITGEVKGQLVQFMVAEDDGATRLEIQFEGVYDSIQQRIEGNLTQRWELSSEEETGGVTLTGRATFVRKEP